MKDVLREIGRIGKPHGIRGEIKIIPQSDDRDRLLGIKTVFIGPDSRRARSFSVSSIRPHISKKGLTILLKLSENLDQDWINSMRGQTLFAKESDLPALKEGEFFYSDIVGFDVISIDEEPLGVVADVIDRPPQDILVLRTHEKKDVFIPFVREFVREVDIESSRVVVSLIEGML